MADADKDMGEPGVEEQKLRTVPELIKEILVVVIAALALAFLLKTFLFQPFNIPSESMEPNLLEGDYIITSKYSVGYGKYAADPFPFPSGRKRLFERPPKRGDILVFRPTNSNDAHIKRLVGLPGDRIQMKDGVLYINDEASTLKLEGLAEMVNEDGITEHAEIQTETFPDGHSHTVYDLVKNNNVDNTSIFLVPPDYYFMMGDNRDRSGDSRTILGYVPTANIIARAEFVLLSRKPEFSLINPFTWKHMRGDRFFQRIE